MFLLIFTLHWGLWWSWIRRRSNLPTFFFFYRLITLKLLWSVLFWHLYPGQGCVSICLYDTFWISEQLNKITQHLSPVMRSKPVWSQYSQHSWLSNMTERAYLLLLASVSPSLFLLFHPFYWRAIPTFFLISAFYTSAFSGFCSCETVCNTNFKHSIFWRKCSGWRWSLMADQVGDDLLLSSLSHLAISRATNQCLPSINQKISMKRSIFKKS